MADTRTVEIVTIDIEEREGLFYATSPDLPEMLLAHDDIATVLEQIPVVVGAIYEHERGMHVSVLQATQRTGRRERPMHRPWVVIPCHPLAQAIA
jgi:hypothetical protein